MYRAGCDDFRAQLGVNFPSEPVNIYSMPLSIRSANGSVLLYAICAHLGRSRHPEIFLYIATIMRGKKVSTDLKYTILALGHYHTVSEIENLMAISRRQIYRIRASWETSGCVEPERAGERRGRPRFLTVDEEAASCFLS